MSKPTITLSGAGPIGSMLAIYLARNGFQVEIFEARPDMRRQAINAGRSINLALAERGIAPLQEVGVFPQVGKICIPMAGRLIHNLDETTQLQKYGQKSHEVIYSISRKRLNCLLLDAAEETGAVEIHFNHTIKSVNFERSQIRVENDGNCLTRIFSVLIGTDGANSIVRKTILDKTKQRDEIDLLDHAYKEIELPAGPKNEFQIYKNALHIWARNKFMLIALPNTECNFTSTLFLPTHSSADSNTSFGFDKLNSKNEINDFFKFYFPDFYKLVPDVADQFLNNPTGSLGTVKCAPWSLGSSLMVIGDAAHAIVPFHGQGMNCGFEDCLVFNEILKTNISKAGTIANLDWQSIFRQVEESRKINTDAIAEMALENYMNMRSDVNDAKYLLKKQLAFKLEQMYPEFIPRYSMVMFNRLPYSRAKEFGLIQDQLLEELVCDANSMKDIDLVHASKRTREILPSITYTQRDLKQAA